ncbi:TolC family protein [Chitinophaga parva]|uniref:TolC family protein n=1 Tax=Chitinophaga parva TaxID=2169414 RepID=A0A2T7BJ30_9BACT|nr:TolC family protein [Chitinophaga parva]PUZ26285.1 TolC family protein [Chitinophaga parva]
MTCRLVLVFSLLFCCTRSSAQQADTLALTLPEAEQQLLQKNIPLLAQRYSLDSAKAAEVTAKLWDNPTLYLENVLYNPTNHKVLDFSSEGERQAQLAQVFKIAGQRNKAVKVAQSASRMTEYQFYDLLRTLRFTLRDDFYRLYYAEQSINLYAEQISSLQKILHAFEDQYKQGNVSLKDVLRIRSLLYDLQSDEAQAHQDLQGTLSDLQQLLRIPATTPVKPVLPDAAQTPPNVASFSYPQLLDSARANRYDLKIAQENVNYNDLNLRLQRSLAVPDVAVGLTYDRQGNFAPNYNGLSVSLPIPLWNRNQGNIKMAHATLEASKLQLQSSQDQLEHDVMDSYQQAIRTQQLLQQVDPAFASDYTHLLGEVQKNFQAHNLNLLEFIDLYGSYRETVLKLNNLRYNELQALENVNFATGTTIYQL